MRPPLRDEVFPPVNRQVLPAARGDNRLSHRAVLSVVSVFLLTAACHRANPDLLFRRSVIMPASEYETAPRFEVFASPPLCGDGTPVECPLERESAFGIAAQGQVLFASPSIRLTELDSSGHVVRTFGAAAGEPGSYGSVAAVTADSVGSIGIFDIRGWSWIGFTGEGARASAVGIPPDPTLVDFHAHGGHVVLRMVPPADSLGAPVLSRFLSVGKDGSARLPFRVPTGALSRGGGLTPLQPLFAPKPVWDLQADGSLVYTEGSSYRVSWFAADGSPAQALVVDGFLPRPVTPADVDRWMAAVRPPVKGQGARQTLLPIPRRSSAKNHPAISDLKCLSDSTVLVRSSLDAQGDSARWDMWGDNGQLLGWLALGSADKVIGGTRARILVATLPPQSNGRIRWLSIQKRSQGS